MKESKKILYFIVAILMCINLIIIPNRSLASLQANGESIVTNNIETWLLNIRKMETINGILGLYDVIDTTNLTFSTTPNNLDIHMQKNTEYGLMAILSASRYGKQSTITSGDTTTGNKSGIVINLNGEWVSAGNLSSINAFLNANNKYKNLYTSTYRELIRRCNHRNTWMARNKRNIKL